MKRLSESVFDNIISRSKNPDIVRKEDDVNRMGRNEFYNYIMDNYEYITDHTRIYGMDTPEEEDCYFSLPVFRTDSLRYYSLHVKYKHGKTSRIELLAGRVECSDFLPKLKEKFTVWEKFAGTLGISKYGEVSNSICLEVLDIIIENVKDPILKKRTK